MRSDVLPRVARRPRRRSACAAAAAVLVVALGAPSVVRGEGAPGRDPLAAAVDQLDADVGGWGGHAAVVAIDTATGRVIVDRHGRDPMTPASNAKLATAAAALVVLGPQHRFATGLYGAMDGHGEARELVLRGDGDPSLSSADLWALAREARDAGLARVGSIAVDQSAFDDQFTPPAFEEQPAEWAPFRAPVSAIPVDENTVTFTIRPGAAGEPATVHVEPPGLVELTGAVQTTKRRVAEAIDLSLTAHDGRIRAKLGGHLPEGSAAHVVRRLEDPRLAPGLVLREILQELGVKVTGDVHLGGEKETHALAVHRSAPLSELLFALGKQSDNFYAEMLLKAIGAEAKGAPGSSAAGAQVVTDLLRRLGALDDGVVIQNGSGLFHGDRLTAHALATVLRAAVTDPSIGPDYVAQLSIGGVDGTLHGRLRRWANTRAIRAKTGTLHAVVALSGYVLAPDGGAPYAFSILVNGVAGKLGPARADMDRVVDALAAQRWGDRAPKPRASARVAKGP